MPETGNRQDRSDRLHRQRLGFGSRVGSLRQKWSATAVSHMLQHFLGSLVKAGFCHGVANCAAHSLERHCGCLRPTALRLATTCMWVPLLGRTARPVVQKKVAPDQKFRALSDNYNVNTKRVKGKRQENVCAEDTAL